MSDTITKWHEMQEENNQQPYHQKAQYVFVFDYDEGNRVFRYEISGLDDNSEVIEAFLIGAGHRLKNCDWMVSKYKFIENGN
jgi:hypothetical protein